MNIIGYGFFYLTCHTIAMRWQTNTYIITLWYIEIQHSCCFFDTIDYFVWGNSTSNKLQNLSLINKIIGHVNLLIYYLFRCSIIYTYTLRHQMELSLSETFENDAHSSFSLIICFTASTFQFILYQTEFRSWTTCA